MPKITGPQGYITVQEAARELQKLRGLESITSDGVSIWIRRACKEELIPYLTQPIGDPHLATREAKLVKIKDVLAWWDK